MEINVEKNGTELTLYLTGNLDARTAPQLQTVLDEKLGGVEHLVLDFAQVGYISSAGLRTVLAAQNWMDAKKGTMVVRNAAKVILNVFKVTGFDTFLTLE